MQNNKNKYLTNLQQAIKAMYDCDCEFVETNHVHEMLEDKTVWKGDVEVFKLINHNEATKAFAWGYIDDNKEMQYVAVLNIPPINNPSDAVGVAILSKKIS